MKLRLLCFCEALTQPATAGVPRLFSAALLAALALLAGCAALQPLPPGATAIAPGLEYWRGEPGLHVLRVDLRRRRVALSAPGDAGRTIDAMPSLQGALAALNASFFDRGFRVRGLTVSAGEAWPDPLAAQDSPLLACQAEAGRQRCRLQLEAPYSLPAGTQTAVAGTPWLVRAGRPRSAQDDAGCAAFCARAHPRSALGLSRDGATLVLLLAEGRRDGVPGLSLAQTAERLVVFGAHEALNLDGGGSSTLLIRGQAVMQRPANEPAQRRIANALRID